MTFSDKELQFLQSMDDYGKLIRRYDTQRVRENHSNLESALNQISLSEILRLSGSDAGRSKLIKALLAEGEVSRGQVKRLELALITVSDYQMWQQSLGRASAAGGGQ